MGSLGLIGSGRIGGTIARLAVDAGIDVVLSNSRGPETLGGVVAALGPRATAATPQEAAEAGDWAVVTIPLMNYRQVPVTPLAGKTVIDTNNYYPGRDGAITELDQRVTTSSELLQDHLVQAHVVKGFNNIFFRHLFSLARPAGSAERSALPIAGEDEAAKRQAAEFMDALGYDTVDAGPLAEGRRFEPGAPAYGRPYMIDPTQPLPADPGSPAAAAAVREALAAFGR